MANPRYDEVTSDKKRNMEYWDQLESYIESVVRVIASHGFDKKTHKDGNCWSLDEDFIFDTSKRVVELTTQRLEEEYDIEFPYIDECY